MTARALLRRGEQVVGIDNLNNYYDPALKQARLDGLSRDFGNRFRFERIDFSDAGALDKLARTSDFDRIVHLGAQAGVRYSLENPGAYFQSNLLGHGNMLELARSRGSSHFVYASSSSVYGGNKSLPFRVEDRVDHPLSLYAASKKSNELMAHGYAHLYRLPVTGLRFFTVYGPWGRPDMAPFLFTRKILAGEPIDVYNHGRHARDFTYIDDVVSGVVSTLDRIAAPNPEWDGANPDPGTSNAPYRLYNIGNHKPVELLDFIRSIEDATGRKAVMNMLPMQPGDVLETFADVDALKADIGFQPATPIDVGIRRLVEWYKDFYRIA